MYDNTNPIYRPQACLYCTHAEAPEQDRWWLVTCQPRRNQGDETSNQALVPRNCGSFNRKEDEPCPA